MDAVDVRSLTKRYGKMEALRGVDLHVPAGTVFGLVGPNGAGKTTLIETLIGVLRPTGGEVRVLGLDPVRDRTLLRRRVGYMPQSPAVYEDLSSQDNVAFFGAAHHVPGLRKRTSEVLEFTGLTERAKDPVHTLSGGMKRRVSLACALVHGPEILFLDEPTAAVDPRLRSRLWNRFRQLARSGATLFISTHLMDEATLCDRVAVLRKGLVIASDQPRRLLERGETRLVVRKGGRDNESVVGGRSEDLAEALRPYGIPDDVGAIGVHADSLEKVMLSIIGEEEE